MEQGQDVPFPAVRRGADGRLYVPAGYVTNTLRAVARSWTEPAGASPQAQAETERDEATVRELAAALASLADAIDVRLITVATGSTDPNGPAPVGGRAPRADEGTGNLGVEAWAVLQTAEEIYQSFTGDTCWQRPLSGPAMAIAARALAGHSLAGYPDRLEAFAVQRRGRLEQFYRCYGPGSARSGDRYALVSHPASVVMCERLQNARAALLGVWGETLPREMLTGVAAAWGLPLS